MQITLPSLLAELQTILSSLQSLPVATHSASLRAVSCRTLWSRQIHRRMVRVKIATAIIELKGILKAAFGQQPTCKIYPWAAANRCINGWILSYHSFGQLHTNKMVSCLIQLLLLLPWQSTSMNLGAELLREHVHLFWFLLSAVLLQNHRFHL